MEAEVREKGEDVKMLCMTLYLEDRGGAVSQGMRGPQKLERAKNQILP